MLRNRFIRGSSNRQQVVDWSGSSWNAGMSDGRFRCFGESFAEGFARVAQMQGAERWRDLDGLFVTRSME